jgi:thioredoxin 1
MQNSIKTLSRSKEEEKLSEDFLDVSDKTFEQEVLQSEIPVLVDFWAAWCAPCKMVVPAMEHLAQTYNNQLRIVKLNVDENMKTSSKYGVMSIPTLLLFKGGELKETILGAQPQEKIVEIVSKHI